MARSWPRLVQLPTLHHEGDPPGETDTLDGSYVVLRVNESLRFCYRHQGKVV